VFCPEEIVPRQGFKGFTTGLHKALIRCLNIAHAGCQLDDLNQVEVSFKANPGHIRINVKKIWTHLDLFGVCKGLMVSDGF